VNTDHALAAAGLAATLSQQSYHAECITASEKAVALLSAVGSDGSVEAVLLSTQQSLSFSLEVLGRMPEAIAYVLVIAVCPRCALLSPQLYTV
jgi:hypothetical protein